MIYLSDVTVERGIKADLLLILVHIDNWIYAYLVLTWLVRR
jgi:hypothetical protein